MKRVSQCEYFTFCVMLISIPNDSTNVAQERERVKEREREFEFEFEFNGPLK